MIFVSLMICKHHENMTASVWFSAVSQWWEQYPILRSKPRAPDLSISSQIWKIVVGTLSPKDRCLDGMVGWTLAWGRGGKWKVSLISPAQGVCPLEGEEHSHWEERPGPSSSAPHAGVSKEHPPAWQETHNSAVHRYHHQKVRHPPPHLRYLGR